MSLSKLMKSTGLMLAAGMLLAACATGPVKDPRATALQNELNRIIGNIDLASRGGQELKNAENAVHKATTLPRKTRDRDRDYYFYAADRLLQTAEMSARARLAEDRRSELVREQEKLVLEARTLEANRARKAAEEAKRSAAEALALRKRALSEAAEAEKMRVMAQAASEQAREQQRQAENAAKSAQSEAEKAKMLAMAETRKAAQARAEAEAAKAERDSLRNRLSELEAKQTERGLLITLGDVLFEFNKSELKPGAARNLQPLIEALADRPEQLVIIEGHTDSIGSHAYNMALSEDRADAVASYLEEHGIDSARITAKGLGPDFPVADNDTNSGRQQNRRVEVILPNPAPVPSAQR